MQYKKPPNIYLLNPDLTTNEMIALINDVVQKVTTHFHIKAGKGKGIFRSINTHALFLQQ